MNAQSDILVGRAARRNAADSFSQLSPIQQATFAQLERIANAAPAVGLMGPAGVGKTTILKAFAEQHDGDFVSMEQCLDGVKLRDPWANDESILMVIEQALDRSDLVVFDDFGTVARSTGGRDMIAKLLVGTLFAKAIDAGKRLIFSTAERLDSWQSSSPNQAQYLEMEPFRAEDYEAIARNLKGDEGASKIDFDLIFRHASFLSGHDLKMACGVLVDAPAPTTRQFIEALDQFVLKSNTRIEEVEALSFDRLPGTEHISSKLETHIILPLENEELARELDIRPKRGVLLYGPPGTGKTSIGRALAHRMKGKFFLIDGSFVTEPPTSFFSKLDRVVREAKENAPSVLFIDDADVLFTIGHIAGLGRYLLSLLDGMESETAGKVCLMMTAMDVRKVPSAILRSGRVELWLETRPPTPEIRAEILKRWMGDTLPGHKDIDYVAVTAAAEGFTPADLRRIVGDAKAFYAADDLARRPIASAGDYLKRSIQALIETRTRMADNLGDETLRIGTAPTRAKYASGIGGLAEANSTCITAEW